MKISFYLVEKSSQTQTDVVCRLCQQIYNKHPIWIYCRDEAQAQHLDDQLWTFSATSFVPHLLIEDAKSVTDVQHQWLNTPILISCDPPPSHSEVCINLTGQALDLTEIKHGTLHLIEIVGHNEAEKVLSRQVFKAYRADNIEPAVHKI